MANAAQIKAALARLAGGGAGAADETMPAVEYKGYRIRPTPYLKGGQYCRKVYPS